VHAEDGRRKGARAARILVVDDNQVNRKLAVALVKNWGFVPLVANDGREALTILAQERVDLILMDVQMPVMDGLAATRAIRGREAESGRHIPIVALTAHAYTSDRARCVEAGMDEFITKPVDHEALHEAILELLRAGNEGDPEVAAETAPGELTDPVEPAAEPREPQFDRQEVLDRVDGDLELLEEIAVLFMEACEVWMGELRRGLADSDAAAIQKAAHTLKGSAASFGARPLIETALRVEKIGASLNLAEADSAVRDLESQVSDLVRELRSFIEEKVS